LNLVEAYCLKSKGTHLSHSNRQPKCHLATTQIARRRLMVTVFASATTPGSGRVACATTVSQRRRTSGTSSAQPVTRLSRWLQTRATILVAMRRRRMGIRTASATPSGSGGTGSATCVSPRRRPQSSSCAPPVIRRR